MSEDLDPDLTNNSSRILLLYFLAVEFVHTKEMLLLICLVRGILFLLRCVFMLPSVFRLPSITTGELIHMMLSLSGT